jgi:hypothetical protein
MYFIEKKNQKIMAMPLSHCEKDLKLTSQV